MAESKVLGKVYLKEQLVALHADLINLLERVEGDELDLFLDNPKKTVLQKAAFVTTLIRELESPALADLFTATVKEGDLDFFGKAELLPFLRGLEAEAEQVLVLPLTVAITFKEKDLRDMAAFLGERSGRKVALALKVDASLIGGAIVRYGSYQSDYSLKARLDQFRGRWRKAIADK